jgi:hypothetical protein
MRSVLFIFFIACSFAAAAQYNKLDVAMIKQLGLYRVIETSITTDSLNHTADSSIEKFIYNTEGKLVEKDQDFTANETVFTSIIYTYNANGFMIDSTVNTPYTSFTHTLSEPPASTCYFYSETGRIKTAINKWQNGITRETDYGYDDQGLLYYIQTTSNIHIGTELRFAYTFYSK